MEGPSGAAVTGGPLTLNVFRIKVLTELGSTCTSALTALLVRQGECRPLIWYFGENNVVGLVIPVVAALGLHSPHVASPTPLLGGYLLVIESSTFGITDQKTLDISSPLNGTVAS